jgi:hypothetical protein
MPRAIRGIPIRTIVSLVVMIAGVLAVFTPWIYFNPHLRLDGSDYILLHERRIRFAQEAIFSSQPHLPAWYSREALGTPFWSNVQNFPWIPTRLVLLLLDPSRALVVGVNMAAVLAAVFTFFYGRSIQLGRLACAAFGWTFACAGFFSTRVSAGHLPLLEAYPALPLMLWLVEKRLAQRRRLDLFYLGISTTCLALAGHPQLPIYALAVAAIYTIGRAPFREAARILAAMFLGGASAMFAVWPFLLLVLRSARVLKLNPPSNDIVFPISRLLSFLFPWHDGWPNAIHRLPQVPLNLANEYMFWDTGCYVGWLPIMAAAFLLLRALVHWKRPDSRLLFHAILGLLALALACGATNILLPNSGGTYLRSPARLIYVTTFALALGLGVAVDVLTKAAVQTPRAALFVSLIGIALALHAFDLMDFDHYFVSAIPNETQDPAGLKSAQKWVGDGRTAIDFDIGLPLNREIDDVGFFDSVVLAKPYAALMDLARQPPGENIEFFNGSQMDDHALQICGVNLVITNRSGPIQTREIPNPLPRASFYSSSELIIASVDQTHRFLRDPYFDFRHRLMLPQGQALPSSTASASSLPQSAVTYHRDSSDLISMDVTTDQSGFLCLLEASDPGWQATVDGSPKEIVSADDVFMAVPLPAGAHHVVLRFSTPGMMVGSGISIASFFLLLLLVAGWSIQK